MSVNSVWWEVGTLLVGVALTVGLLAVGHWFPWPQRLSRIRAYQYGTVAIWLGFSLWRSLVGDWQTVVGLAVISLAGGVMVILAYRVDQVVQRVRQAEKAEAVDDELG